MTQTKYVKYCLHKTIKFETLMQLIWFILLLRLEKCFEVIENVKKKMKFEEEWAEL